MAFSTGYANNILNYLFGRTTLTAPTKIYMGLCTNTPEADGGTFSELTDDWYERTLIVQRGETSQTSSTFYTDLMSYASNRAVQNLKQINWPKALNSVTVKGFGLFSAPTGGTPFYYGDFDEPVTCEAGAVMLFSPEMFKIEFKAIDESIT